MHLYNVGTCSSVLAISILNLEVSLGGSTVYMAKLMFTVRLSKCPNCYCGFRVL